MTDHGGGAESQIPVGGMIEMSPGMVGKSKMLLTADFRHANIANGLAMGLGGLVGTIE